MPPPPPPYTPSSAQYSSSTPRRLASLPLPLLFKIISFTLDPRATPSAWVSEEDEERVRRVCGLFYMRGVCRSFWLVCTSLLRTRYHPAYLDMIQPGYSSDAYPHDSHPSFFEASSVGLTVAADVKGSTGQTSPSSSVFATRSRETTVFDRWIAIRMGDELRKVESELSEDSGAERDIFARFQPAARIEDLLPVYVPTTLIVSTSSTAGPPTTTLPLPHPHLSVTLTPGWCQLFIWAKPYGKPANGKDMVIEVRRESTLEGTVRRIGEGLEDMGRGLVEWGGRVL